MGWGAVGDKGIFHATLNLERRHGTHRLIAKHGGAGSAGENSEKSVPWPIRIQNQALALTFQNFCRWRTPTFCHHRKNMGSRCVCVCVYVCVRERESSDRVERFSFSGEVITS